MSWMGFLQGQTGSSSDGFSQTYSAGFTSFANSLGVSPAQYLEAHLHAPKDYPLPGGNLYGSPAAVAAATGVNPTETAYSLFGHTIPLTAFGVGRIGGEIISGPVISGGLASFITSYGVPADPTGTRDLREIAFDSEVVWDTAGASGVTTSAGGTFRTEAFTFRFYQGTLTQSADALETARYGAQANAYRPQILLAFENLPIGNTKFGKIPYVSAVFGDGTGDDVNFGEMFERLANSPWVNIPGQFETSGITDGVVDGGLIIAQDEEFLGLIQKFGRFYRNWDILQTDKLRIVDRGDNVTPDIILNKTHLMGGVTLARAEPNSVPRELELATIDPDADYTIVPSKASFPRDPVNVSSSVRTETAYLPVIMDSSTRQSIVTYTKYYEEIARKKFAGRSTIFGLEMEPGDLLAGVDLGDGFVDETFKVVETTHGADHSVEFIAESFMDCQIPTGDSHFSNVVLLMGFEGADGSTGAPGMTDESPALHGNATVTGGQVDTAQFVFGAASLLPPIEYPGDADWNLSAANSDQFTVECFVRHTAISPTVQVIVSVGFVQTQWYLAISRLAGFQELSFGWRKGGGGGNTFIDTSGAALDLDTWYFVAVDKDATGKIRIYRGPLGGHADMVGSDTPADSSFETGGNVLKIGEIGLFGSNDLGGWVDEIRITKGVARYASDAGFEVPVAAFPRDGT